MFGSRGWVAQDARKPSRTAKSKPITSAATTGAMGPAQVQFKPGDPGDPRIGADPLSVVELAADVRRVESEQIQIEAST
jgi:hypothetical protein